MTYIEDGPEIYPLNIDDFSIDDEDNSFVLQATLTIENSDALDSDFRDSLSATGNSDFSVNGSGTTQLFIETTGFRRLITTHEDFARFLRGVSFTTTDQAPHVVRNLSVLVEEFPVGESARVPVYIPITVQPVNDQPVLESSRVDIAPLLDYLPQETANLGFNASFLLSLEDVDDVDRRSPVAPDFVGFAVIREEVSADLGVWQYRESGNESWIDFSMDESPCDPIFFTPSRRIRFSPAPSFAKSDVTVMFEYQAWDGTSVPGSECPNPLDTGMQDYYRLLTDY